MTRYNLLVSPVYQQVAETYSSHFAEALCSPDCSVVTHSTTICIVSVVNASNETPVVHLDGLDKCGEIIWRQICGTWMGEASHTSTS